jgi:hypothetical protein
MFNFIKLTVRQFYEDYGILATFVAQNIILGTFGLVIFFSRIIVPLDDVKNQASILKKSRFYNGTAKKLCFIWPSLLQLPALIKALLMPKNWRCLLLVLVLSAAVATPIYYWPLKTGGIIYVTDEAWVHIQYMCRPLSPLMHLIFNFTLVRCVGKRTIGIELGLTLLFFTFTFLQFCLILIAFQS